MSWTYLCIAGLLEVGWAVGLKHTEGWTKLWPSVLTVVTMIASFYFLALAVRVIPLGTGYAVWTGIGAAGTAVCGIALFDEAASPARLACIALIVLGVVGLKLTSQ
jgi:quaternary ammonium compound-resistance protein SugE